jgi:hypothetical protein
MANNPSKKRSKENETKNRIPTDCPLGQMLKYWSKNLGPKTKESNK